MGGELTAGNSVRGGGGGGGTCFTLHLPLQCLDASWPSAALALPPAGAAAPAPGGDLLVMEGDARQRATWTGIAEAAGYQVATCATREAILAELARRAQQGRVVDIVICSDHDAEAYDRLGREIVADGGLGKPALVMLPGVGNPGDARRLMDAGFRAYLVKPVAPADLREVLETLRRTPRVEWHTLFLTRHSLAESRLGEQGVEAGTVDAGFTELLEP